MSSWSWLSNTLHEKQESFGTFSECRAFRSRIQSSIGRGASDFRSIQAILRSEDEVHAYLDALDQSSPEVHILAFTNPDWNKIRRLPLPLSQKLFDRIKSEFNLSPDFLAAFNSGSIAYSGPSANDQDEEIWMSAQYIIQNVRSRHSFSMALTFDIRSGRTCVALFGVESSFVTSLYACLESMTPLPYGSMVVPTTASEIHANTFSEIVKELTDQIYAIEATTGMRQFDREASNTKTGAESWKTVDLIGVTRDLSSLLSRLAFLKLQGDSGIYLLQQIKPGTELLTTELQRRQEHSRVKDQHQTISKLSDIINSYHSIKLRSTYLSERATAQTQTVYSLIASQDNLTTIALSRASHRIAASSQTITAATAQDSAVMRVIAVVTMFFLPATFTSTFFSMTFFNFLDTQTPRASPYIWIYVVVTVVLTVLVQGLWAMVARKEKAKILAQT